MAPKSLSPPITAYDSTWAPSAAPPAQTAEFGVLPRPFIAAAFQRNCLYFCISCCWKKKQQFSYLENQNLHRQKESIHPREAPFPCSPIPCGLNYPVIQESFFFCVDQAGVKGFSVFEMVYVMLLLLKQAGM